VKVESEMRMKLQLLVVYLFLFAPISAYSHKRRVKKRRKNNEAGFRDLTALVDVCELTHHRIKFEALGSELLTVGQMLKTSGVTSLSTLTKLDVGDLVLLLDLELQDATKLLRYAKAAEKAQVHARTNTSPTATSTSNSNGKSNSSNNNNNNAATATATRVEDQSFAADLLSMFPELNQLSEQVNQENDEEDESTARLVAEGLETLFPTLTDLAKNVDSQTEDVLGDGEDEDEETEEEMRREMDMEEIRERLQEESEKRARERDDADHQERQKREETRKEKVHECQCC